MADRNRVRCACLRCTIRGLMGPAVIVTVGILLLLHETRGGYLDLGETWPVILLVIGGVSLASALAPMSGHIVNGAAPPFVHPGPPMPPAPPAPPVGTPGGAWQPPDSGRGQ